MMICERDSPRHRGQQSPEKQGERRREGGRATARKKKIPLVAERKEKKEGKKS